jgi:hypothetical protein
MSNRTNKNTRGAKRKRARQQNRQQNEWEFAAYAVGDMMLGGELFDPLTGAFDFSMMPSGGINVIGDPTKCSGEPVMREATLDDVEDDCPICQEMRRQILAGNPPQVLAYE